MAEVSQRQRLVEQQVERAGATASYGLPCVLAVVAAFLPMFSYVDTSESQRYQEATGDRSTLLGLVLDPGTTGNDVAIRWIALALLLSVGACVALTPTWVAAPRGWPGRAITAGAALAVPLFLALFLLTSQGDGRGSFGTESVDPVAAYALALVVPVWFLVVRSRESSW